ncbi:MAG: SBBP repeat-containing protein [Planctomycetes bacterium]|nr:SBBP repeat-containing protein [Planctomycetota bacterium]
MVLACALAIWPPIFGANQSYEAAFITYLGASRWERIQSVFVDEGGYIYVGGTTKSSDFPTTPGAYDRKGTGTGVNDSLVAKLSPDGTRLVWSTYLHGSQRDDVYGVWAARRGLVYGTGWTGYPDLATTAGACDRTHNGKNDVFLVKLAPDGSQLVFATLFGGSGVDQCRGGMAVDDSGSVYLSGYTDSLDFPVTCGAIQQTF